MKVLLCFALATIALSQFQQVCQDPFLDDLLVTQELDVIEEPRRCRIRASQRRQVRALTKKLRNYHKQLRWARAKNQSVKKMQKNRIKVFPTKICVLRVVSRRRSKRQQHYCRRRLSDNCSKLNARCAPQICALKSRLVKAQRSFCSLRVKRSFFYCRRKKTYLGKLHCNRKEFQTYKALRKSIKEIKKKILLKKVKAQEYKNSLTLAAPTVDIKNQRKLIVIQKHPMRHRCLRHRVCRYKRYPYRGITPCGKFLLSLKNQLGKYHCTLRDICAPKPAFIPKYKTIHLLNYCKEDQLLKFKRWIVQNHFDWIRHRKTMKEHNKRESQFDKKIKAYGVKKIPGKGVCRLRKLKVCRSCLPPRCPPTMRYACKVLPNGKKECPKPSNCRPELCRYRIKNSPPPCSPSCFTTRVKLDCKKQ